MDGITLFYTLLDLVILVMVFVSLAMDREYVILILGATTTFVVAMVITFNVAPYFSQHRNYELVNRRVGKHKKNFYLFTCVCLVSLSWILVYTQNNIGIVKFISFMICLPWLIYVLKYHVCTDSSNDTGADLLIPESVINVFSTESDSDSDSDSDTTNKDLSKNVVTDK